MTSMFANLKTPHPGNAQTSALPDATKTRSGVSGLELTPYEEGARSGFYGWSQAAESEVAHAQVSLCGFRTAPLPDVFRNIVVVGRQDALPLPIVLALNGGLRTWTTTTAKDAFDCLYLNRPQHATRQVTGHLQEAVDRVRTTQEAPISALKILGLEYCDALQALAVPRAAELTPNSRLAAMVLGGEARGAFNAATRAYLQHLMSQAKVLLQAHGHAVGDEPVPMVRMSYSPLVIVTDLPPPL